MSIAKVLVQIVMFVVLLLTSSLGYCSSASPASQEESNAAPTDAIASVEDTDSPTAPEKVNVEPIARDDEIETRLRQILEATNYFKQPAVRVEDGVVFLTGEATQAENKAWASNLASKTQDVAAVVNRMSIAEKSIWDFSEAVAELKSFRVNVVQAIPFILFGLAILLITWMLAKLAGYLSNRILKNRVPNNLLRRVTTWAAMLPILIFGIYLVLRVSGLTQLALTVLGGTGLIGLVIGIAFQDIAENFLASILISVQQPFRIGDLVKVQEHTGIVQRVTTRGTTLLTPDGNHVQIPNSVIYKNTIENFTANPLRRVNFLIGIGYDDSTTEAQEIVMRVIGQHSATLNDPPPKVLLDSLGAATVNLQALFWIDGTKNDLLSVKSSCMRIAKQALLEAGISLPDESREVIFPNGVPVKLLDSIPQNVTDVSRNSVSEKNVFERSKSRENRRAVASDSDRMKQQPIKQQPKEQMATEAEGNMRSEIDDLKRQAKESWLPGNGEQTLVGEAPATLEEL